MSNDYLAQVTGHVNAVKRAAQDATASLGVASAQQAEASEKIKGATANISAATMKEDPTLNIRVWNAKEIRRQSARVEAAYERAKKAREEVEGLAEAAKKFLPPPEQGEIEGLVADAVAHYTVAKNASEAAQAMVASTRKDEDAAKVAEGLLNLEKFFEGQKGLIYDRLESCNEIARKPGANSDMVFIAEGLPIINGIINVGSSRQNYQKAVEWVKREWGDEAEPLLVLSALVFIYVVNRGVIDHIDSPEQDKQSTWEEMRERVDRVL